MLAIYITKYIRTMLINIDELYNEEMKLENTKNKAYKYRFVLKNYLNRKQFEEFKILFDDLIINNFKIFKLIGAYIIDVMMQSKYYELFTIHSIKYLSLDVHYYSD